jgi:two-component system sensor histidine kinase RstB
VSKWFFVQIVLLTLVATIVGNTGFRPEFMDNWTPYMEKIEHHRGAGIITMLADELNLVEQGEQAKLLEILQMDFGYVIALKPLDSLNLSAQQRIKINSGEVIFDRSSFELMVLLQGGQTLVVIENMEQSAAHIINPISMSITSTINVIKILLAEIDESQWQPLVDRVSSIGAVPFDIKTHNQLPLNVEQKSRLTQLGTLSIETEASRDQLIPGDIIYSRISNSDKSIVLGPITPAINEMVNKTLLESYVLGAFILLLPLLAWIVPTWLSARRLRQGSKNFAKENLHGRVKYVFASNLNGVAKTFNKMADKLERLLNRNKLLASAISHDLRTPISAMEFSLELLSNSHDQQSRKRYLNQMKVNLESLRKMHKELQLYTEFDQREIRLDIHIQPLDAWLNRHLDVYWQNKTISVSITEKATNCYCALDNAYLGRALDNLLSNGFYYAKTLLHIALSTEGQHCLISVENDGEPIDKISRDEIFEPFVRLNHGYARERDSSGLGLAIVRQIMSWHEGSVRVEDSELGGAKFILCLPIVPNKQEVSVSE